MQIQNTINVISTIPALYQNKLLPSVEALLQSKWGRMVGDPQFRGQLIDLAEAWLTKHKESPLAAHLIRLLKMLRPLLTGTEPLSKTKMLAIAAAVLYVISTLDAVPDFLPLIGWLDDLGVITMVLRYVLGERVGEALSGITGKVLTLVNDHKA